MKILVIIVCSLTCDASAQDAWVVRPDGVGPVKVGMTLDQLNMTLHEHFRMPVNNEDLGCFYVKPKSHPTLAFMIEDGHFVRVDVDEPGIATEKAVRVGDSEDQIKRAYGAEVNVEPSKYTGDEGGHYLTVRSTDGKYGIRFETEKRKITELYAGTYKTIQYIEGCE